MIDKLSGFFIGKAHAEPRSFFNLVDPFKVTIGDGSADTILNTLMGRVTIWLVAAAAAVAFVYLVVSGIQYITAGGDSEKATKARTGILNAIIGIVVVALAWIIIVFAAGLGRNLGGVR